jgi:acetyltransferase-like isoleucine patch superfamily enzyme
MAVVGSPHRMTARVFVGSVLAYVYNGWVGQLPVSGLRRWYLRLYLGRMGAGAAVQMGCRFLNGRRVFLGERNVINFGCLFDGRRYRIETGDDVSIGPCASLLTLGHDPRSPDFADRGGDVTVGSRAWIGYGALVLPGVKVGEGAVVGAGAAVTQDVAPHTIVAGNPARVIGERPRDLAYRLDHYPFLT